MISERILAAFDMTVVRRGHSAPTSVLADYWTLTRPEVRKGGYEA